MHPDEKAHVTRIVENLVEGRGFETLRLTISDRRHLTLTLDRDGDPVNIDDCAVINRFLRKTMTEQGVDSDNYSIDVESPGVKRELKTLRHFERFIGEPIRVNLAEPTADGTMVVSGTLKGVEPPHFILAPKVGRSWKLTLEEIEFARLDPQY